MTALWILLVLAAGTLLLARLFWRQACRRSPDADFTVRKHAKDSPFTLYRDRLAAGLAYVDGLSGERVDITARDGTPLTGTLFRAEREQCLVILVHGYRSSGRADFCCAAQPFLAAGRSLLMIDERACGRSGGKSITYGAREQYDVQAWAEYAAGRFPGLPLVLEGMSMGAAVVLMAAGLPLPATVRGVIADCGYTSAREIILYTLMRRGYPAAAVWPFLRAGARLWGGFDPADVSAEDSLRRARVPVLFIHGEADPMVPCAMGRRNFAACASPKRIVTVPGAGHGFSFLTDPEKVRAAIDAFLSELCHI